MRTYRAVTALLAAAASCALTVACSEPGLSSDLQTEGPPEVVEVNVLSEGSVFGDTDPDGLLLGEAATYCRPGERYKVHTTYCPLARDEIDAPIPGDREVEPLMDTVPYGPVLGFNSIWHVRIIFDELLDPSVEDLVTDETGTTFGTLAETQPVILRCGGAELPYDGFYDPSGNWLTFPPGPALVIQTGEFVASGTSDCEVEIREGAVEDKDGNPVPEGQLGPYDFGIAALSVYSTDPVDQAEGVSPEGDELGQVAIIELGAPIDLASVAGNVTLADAEGNPVSGTLGYYVAEPTDPTSEVANMIAFTPDAPLAEETVYVLTISNGITDIEGGALVLTETDDDTGEVMVVDSIDVTFETGVVMP